MRVDFASDMFIAQSRNARSVLATAVGMRLVLPDDMVRDSSGAKAASPIGVAAGRGPLPWYAKRLDQAHW